MATVNSTDTIITRRPITIEEAPKPIHADDIEASFEGCSNVFGHLEAIFAAIEKESEEFSHIRKLASAGRKLAGDYENMADVWREEVKNYGVSNE